MLTNNAVDEEKTEKGSYPNMNGFMQIIREDKARPRTTQTKYMSHFFLNLKSTHSAHIFIQTYFLLRKK
jgi:hypothetical protein